MRRRAFLSVVCSAVAWPLAAAAQQSTNKKRLAIFSPAEQARTCMSIAKASLPEPYSRSFGG